MERDDRVPVVGYSKRSTAGSRGRPRPPAGSRFRHSRLYIGGASNSSYHHNDSDCQSLGLHRHHAAPKRQYYRFIRRFCPSGGKAHRTSARLAATRNHDCCFGDPPSGLTDAQEAARVLGLQIKVLIADTDQELDAAMASLPQMRPDALLVGPNAGPLFFTRADKIVAAAEQLAIPAMYFRREFVLAGGLMSYGTSADQTWEVMGEYTGRIL